MSHSVNRLYNATNILLDLQKNNEIAQSFSGSLDAKEIAVLTTDGLVNKFDCAFARIWILDSDQVSLKLAASSGLYTNINGTFSQIPMGAFKVGKIAQNRVAFLSNNLVAESWVGNRQWAIDNNIKGFAGYPLATKERVIGVLALFSYRELEGEFLEALQSLCAMVTLALDNALHYQKEKQNWQSSITHTLNRTLSDQLATLLTKARLVLVGTEYPLNLSLTYIFLKLAEILDGLNCSYSRLIYAENNISLEAIVPNTLAGDPQRWLNDNLGQVFLAAYSLGGFFNVQNIPQRDSIQVALTLPSIAKNNQQSLRVHCSSLILQLAFTQLATMAGFQVTQDKQKNIPLLTDSLEDIFTSDYILWLSNKNEAVPKQAKAKIDLSINPQQLQEAVNTVINNKLWGLSSIEITEQIPSDRELEILLLLTQGLRDRDIAKKLIISESTVKFHINNLLKKLKVKTRYQLLHQAMVIGWLN